MSDLTQETKSVLDGDLTGWTYHVGRQGRGMGFLATLSSADYRPAIFQTSPQVGFHYRAEAETADLAMLMAIGFSGHAVP